jgi:hypothetical protein
MQNLRQVGSGAARAAAAPSRVGALYPVSHLSLEQFIEGLRRVGVAPSHGRRHMSLRPRRRARKGAVGAERWVWVAAWGPRTADGVDHGVVDEGGEVLVGAGIYMEKLTCE